MNSQSWPPMFSNQPETVVGRGPQHVVTGPQGAVGRPVAALLPHVQNPIGHDIFVLDTSRAELNSRQARALCP